MFKKIYLLLYAVLLILCVAGCSGGGKGHKISSDELGLKAYLARVEDSSVASAEVSEDGSCKITALKAGTTVVSVMNSYGETVEVTVTVDDKNKITADYEKFEKPANYVIATEAGLDTESFDNAEVLQKMIDSLTEGGVIYVPKGIYKLGFVQLKDNITICLEGVLSDYNTEYSDELAERVSGGNEFAVLQAVRGGNDMFANHERNGYGREGADNFAITGGVIDMGGKSRCFIWTCAENVLLENVIMKDCPNNHAIQISGSKNVTIQNVMFAGYAVGNNVTTGEVIQIEETNPLCIGTGTTAATLFDEYEFYSSENVVIKDCYFGRSDEYGPPTFAIGHHGCNGKYSAAGIQIVNCFFDNPLICAIRAYGWNDVEITGCNFVSDEEHKQAAGHYMIGIKMAADKDVQLPSGAFLVKNYERGGCRNVNIHDNEFTIGADSQIGGILQTLNDSDIAYDAIAEVNLSVADFYTDAPYTFTGYKMVNNQFTDISFCNNKVTVENTINKNYINLNGVKGFKFENNDITAAETNLMTSVLDGEKVEGTMLTKCTGEGQRQRNVVVSATSANKTAPIVLVTPAGENPEGFCSAASAEFTVTCEEGGTIKRSAASDGTLTIEAVADEGYTFDGYYLNGTKLGAGRFTFGADAKVTAVFKAN